MKKTILLTLILVLIVFLVSCDKNENDSSTTPPTPTHTVTFSLNDGSDSDFVKEVEKGTGVPRPKDPERMGYTFEGWYVGDEKWSFLLHTVSYDITLYAKWTPVAYQIEYIGAIGERDTYTIEDEFMLGGKPANSKEAFFGWYLDEELTKPIIKIEKGTTGNLKLYAKTVELNPEPNYTTPLELVYYDYGYIVVGCKEGFSNITIPKTYNGKAVKKIASYAFYNYKSLISITIPSTIESIGDGAFAECTSLKTVNLEDGIELIESEAFKKCKSLEKIVIPESVTRIEEGAFFENDELIIYVKAEEKPQDWDESWNKGAPTIWGFIEETTQEGFLWAKTSKGALITGYKGKNTDIKIPSTIGGSVVLGIFDRGLKNYAITSVTIPRGIEIIGNDAFGQNQRLKIYTELEEKPQGWSSLECPVAWGYTGVHGANEDGYEWAETTKGVVIMGYKGAEASLEIPSHIMNKPVVEICDYTFYSRFALTSITLPSTITEIGRSAFSYCEALESVTLGESINIIKDKAFYYCTALKSIYLSNSVTSIGKDTFRSCPNLTIYCEAESKPENWHTSWVGSSNTVVWGSDTL